MKIANKSLIIALVALSLSVSVNVFMFLKLKSQSRNDQCMPWSGPANWLEIHSDQSIPINYSNSNNLPFLEYDCDVGVITKNTFANSVIVWRDGECMMILLYSSVGSGCNLARIDTKNKSIVYFTPLYGIGPVDHSQYKNRVRVYKNDDLIMIVGNESAGNYREIRRIADGSLILVEQKYMDFHIPPFIKIKSAQQDKMPE